MFIYTNIGLYIYIHIYIYIYIYIYAYMDTYKKKHVRLVAMYTSKYIYVYK